MRCAVAASEYRSDTWSDYLTDWYAIDRAHAVGIDRDSGAVRVFYVQIFAKGDAATPDDFRRFFVAAKATADPEQWDSYRLDERYSALSNADQGPGPLDKLAQTTGLSSAWDSVSGAASSAWKGAGDAVSAGVDKLMLFALAALAVVVLIVKKT